MIDKIKEDLVKAMKEKDKDKINTLRLLNSAIKNEEIKKRDKLEDSEIAILVQKEIKKRREAIELYEKGGREELADNEKKELKILEIYLPEQLSDDELAKAIDAAIEEVGAAGPSDMGKVMKVVMSKHQGQVDGKVVRELVQKKLT